jgi:predicted transcriptional regulator
MELQPSEKHTAELATLSTRTGRSMGELVEEAVDRLLADESWFDQQVRLAIDQIARGEFLDEAEMDARLARMKQA